MQKVQEPSNPEFNTQLTHQQLFTLLTSSLDLVSNMHQLPMKKCMSNMFIYHPLMVSLLWCTGRACMFKGSCEVCQQECCYLQGLPCWDTPVLRVGG